jgi:hypothetical protein
MTLYSFSKLTEPTTDGYVLTFDTVTGEYGPESVSAGGQPAGEVSPAALTANTNNLATGRASLVRLTTNGGGPYNLTGLDASQWNVGDSFVLFNIHATDSINLKHLDANSSASNQFNTGGSGLDRILLANTGSILIRDGTTGKFRVVY